MDPSQRSRTVDRIGRRPSAGRAGSPRGLRLAPVRLLAQPGLRSAGFTLIEMLVALAVFSLAALALLRLQWVTLRTAADLGQRALAQLSARNLAVEALTDPAPPPLGEASGVVDNGGRQLTWSRTVTRDEDPRFLLVTITAGGGPGASPAVLTVLRRAQ